jgi:hypothetical protein
MKSPFKIILTLGMRWLIAAACVSPPPASPESGTEATTPTTAKSANRIHHRPIPDGSILVTCIEGAVTVQSPEGQTANTQPGRAVINSETGLAATSVGLPEPAKFLNSWRRDNFTEFAGQAACYSSTYAATLDGNRHPFDAALADGMTSVWEALLLFA